MGQIPYADEQCAQFEYLLRKLYALAWTNEVVSMLESVWNGIAEFCGSGRRAKVADLVAYASPSEPEN
jgi:hypothetical protein